MNLHSLSAQTIIRRDLEIDQMVKEISSDSLQSYVNQLVGFTTRNTLSTTTDKKKGIGAARSWVLQKFNDFAHNSGGRMAVYLDTTTLLPDGKRVDGRTQIGNPMAVLKGTDPTDDRIYVISGHIDSRGTDVMNRNSPAPGANDDGSGSSAVIECARILSKHSFSPTLIFVTVAGEEQGLLGASFLAAKAKGQKWNIEALLNNDIMGSNNSSETRIIDNTRLRVFSEGIPAYETEKNLTGIRAYGLENDGKARELARYVKETGERYVDNLEIVMISRNDRYLRGGDHSAFVQNGFAAVRLTEMNENYNHQHQDPRTEKETKFGDLEEFMDFEYLRKNTAVNLSTLANLAKAPSLPQEVKIDVKDLTNKTTIRWKVPKTGNPKGSYILMRATTAPTWERKIFTTHNEVVLPYSKDNYFFAVQSVNETGNESLPVIPIPAR
ncbi:MAG: M20/M25/M40 family metallo-hydrolase [Flavisolibacter sp.]